MINSLDGVDVPVFVNPEVREDLSPNRFGIGGLNPPKLSDVLEVEGSESDSCNSSIASPMKIIISPMKIEAPKSIKTFTAACDKINQLA